MRKWLAAEAYAAGRDAHRHHHDVNRHDEHIGSFVLTADAAIPSGTLDMFLELLRATHGTKLLRIKGVVKLAEMPDQPLVVHGVQHVFHPAARLDRWPDDDHRTRLVFITRDLPERIVRELFEAFLGIAAPDRPDRAALVDIVTRVGALAAALGPRLVALDLNPVIVGAATGGTTVVDARIILDA